VIQRPTSGGPPQRAREEAKGRPAGDYRELAAAWTALAEAAVTALADATAL
jgi:hypothetical protein